MGVPVLDGVEPQPRKAVSGSGEPRRAGAGEGVRYAATGEPGHELGSCIEPTENEQKFRPRRSLDQRAAKRLGSGTKAGQVRLNEHDCRSWSDLVTKNLLLAGIAALTLGGATMTPT